jgi:sulfur relay (sulfurtransferase) DsrC/TusE family protein
MNQHTLSYSDTEISGSSFASRLSELDAQAWSRSKSNELAKLEGLDLNDDHWAVISFLRSHYLWNGEKLNESQISGALNQYFLKLGGEKYLDQLFKGGVVTQGRRLANIHPG